MTPELNMIDYLPAYFLIATVLIGMALVSALEHGR